MLPRPMTPIRTLFTIKPPESGMKPASLRQRGIVGKRDGGLRGTNKKRRRCAGVDERSRSCGDQALALALASFLALGLRRFRVLPKEREKILPLRVRLS